MINSRPLIIGSIAFLALFGVGFPSHAFAISPPSGNLKPISTNITPGQTVTLSANPSGATTCYTPAGSFPGTSQTFSVSPNVSLDYFIHCTGPGGSSVGTAVIIVTQPNHSTVPAANETLTTGDEYYSTIPGFGGLVNTNKVEAILVSSSGTTYNSGVMTLFGSAPYFWSYAPTVVSQGSYTLTIKDGNTGATLQIQPITISFPTASIGTKSFTTSTPTFGGAESNMGYDFGATLTSSSGVSITDTPIYGNGSWSWTVPNALPNGTYTLNVSYGGGIGASIPLTLAQSTITINSASPPPPTNPVPAINFTDSPSSPPPFNNTPVALNWTTTNATSCSLTGPQVGTNVSEPVNGSTNVILSAGSENEDPEWTLSCTGPGGQNTAYLYIYVAAKTTLPPPQIHTFTATPSTINVGQSSLLQWTETSGNCQDPITGAIDSGNGSHKVSPTTTTTYTLVCTNSNGVQATANVTVTVNGSAPTPPTVPAPYIDVFGASQTTITAGQSTDLIWDAMYSVSCSSNPNFGNTVHGNAFVSPTVTTTYTLTCANSVGVTTSQSVTITVNPASPPPTPPTPPSTPAPTILYFYPDSSSITAGQSDNLHWASANAVSCNTPGSATSGSESVSPTVSTTYTLVCTNSVGVTASQNTTINVTPAAPSPAPVITFNASNTTITAGQSDQLNWLALNATSCSIPGFSISAISGAQLVSPTTTTTYTITCTGPGGSSSKSTTITVVSASPTPAPTILYFYPSSATITAGQTDVLFWYSTNATSCSIPGVPAATAVSGSQSVTPTATVTYTITCTGTGGSVSQSTTITVKSAPPANPPTATIYFTSPTITAGQSTDIIWNSTYTTTCVIPGVTTSATFGVKVLTPTTTTTYTITCTGPGGTVSASATVTVNALPPPTISYFYPSSATITSGQTDTLYWASSGAASCSVPGVPSITAPSGSQSVMPTATVTYTITCTGTGGSASKSTTITVNAPTAPTIVYFYPSNGTINSGESDTLYWDATGATSCSVPGVPAISAVSGAQSVMPTATVTYTITCTGPGGSVSKSTTITVTILTPTISSFYPDSPTITAGQNDTLEWYAVNVTSCSLPGFTTTATTGSQAVSPTVTTSYTLTCTGPGGSVSKSTSITVNGAPAPVITLYPTLYTLNPGQTTYLNWTSTNATSCSLPGYPGVTAVGGMQLIAPTVTTAYTMTCTGAGGSTSKSVTVVVNVPPPATPTITAFYPDSGTITAGQTDNLNWSSTGATSCSITGLSGGGTSGKAAVSPMVTTTYTLTCTSFGGSVSQATSITVNPSTVPAPVINTFYPTSATIAPGQTDTLNWTSTNAVSCTVFLFGGSGPSGSLSVSPTTNTNYTLTCTNSAGATVSQSTVITVTAPPAGPAPTILVFNASNGSISAGASDQLNWYANNATSCSVPGVPAITATHGAQIIMPAVTTTYVLTCTGTGGSSSANTTVTVYPLAMSYDNSSIIASPFDAFEAAIAALEAELKGK